jgi:biotin transport system ATP-binding protein
MKAVRQLIEIEGVSHRFAGGDHSLHDVSLAVGAGQFVLLAGANGSGKTTLLRHLNGLLAPSRGVVRIDGLSTVGDVGGVRRRVGLVFQDADSQIVGETVWEDVVFGPENLGLPPAEIAGRSRRALAAVGLTGFEQRLTHQLSGGEKRRLAIAGALAMQPAVVALDEPFAGLDYPATILLIDHLKLLLREGKTILVATHEVEKVISLAQRLLVLDHGHLVADGNPAEIVPLLGRYGVRPPCSVVHGGTIIPWS